jgi:putative nucleotidyltransferase with HDIG domain
MWPFTKQSARRKDIRRSKAERGLRWYQRLPRRVHWVTIWSAIGAAVVSAVLVNAGGDVLELRVGQVSPRGITSRLDFRLENEARTIERRARARDNAPNYYELDVSLLQDIQGRLTSALALARAHSADPARFQEEARRNKIRLDENARDELLRIAALTDAGESQRAAERFGAAVADAVFRLANQAPLMVEAIDPSLRRTAMNAILLDPRQEGERRGPAERPVPISQLVHSSQAEALETVAAAAANSFEQTLRASMQASITAMLTDERDDQARPIYRYSAERSLRAAQEAYAAVPTQFDTYGRGSTLADAGPISPDELRLLRFEHEEYQRWIASGQASPEEAKPGLEADPAAEQAVRDRAAARRAQWRRLEARVGYASLALLVPLGLAYYLSQSRRTLGLDFTRHIITALVLLAALGMARTVYVTTTAAYYAVGIQALAAAVLAIVYGRRSDPAVAGSLALLITLSTRQSVGFFLVLLAVSLTLQFGLRDVRSRGRTVLVGAAAAVVALGTALAAGVVGGQTFEFVLRYYALPAMGATLAAAFVIEGILPGIERVFRVSTDMSLLEWCDASKPLLRILAAEAPGTYNHSLLVGTLAETAAEAIGAHGLLARAGSYYHDIGKINKPEYFAENQAFGVSRHDRLSPAMSHLIIIGHVKDGIEMAREYGLPASLHPFIAEHHGTTLVEYFYHAASQQRKPGEREVSDVHFRYPGPKPQTREAAVVMLCDGVEGAVRAMPEPTPNRIEDTVTRIVQRRLVDGQFDECDLTFRELEMIERSLVKSLCAMYHSRIAYPEQAQDKRDGESRAS